MDKAGSFNPNTTNTTKVPAWTARANTVVTAANELVATGNGIRLLTAYINFNGAGGSYIHRVFIRVNNVEVASASNSGPGGVTATVTQDVKNGDLVSVWISSNLSTRSSIDAGYLTLDAA